MGRLKHFWIIQDIDTKEYYTGVKFDDFWNKDLKNRAREFPHSSDCMQFINDLNNDQDTTDTEIEQLAALNDRNLTFVNIFNNHGK